MNASSFKGTTSPSQSQEHCDSCRWRSAVCLSLHYEKRGGWFYSWNHSNAIILYTLRINQLSPITDLSSSAICHFPESMLKQRRRYMSCVMYNYVSKLAILILYNSMSQKGTVQTSSIYCYLSISTDLYISIYILYILRRRNKKTWRLVFFSSYVIMIRWGPGRRGWVIRWK